MEPNMSTGLPNSAPNGEGKVSFFLEFLLMATATLVFAVYLKFSKKLKNKETSSRFIDLASLPGPNYLIPYVGTSLQLLPISNTLNVFNDWCRKYGPLFQAVLAGRRYIILNSASSVEALLKSSSMGHMVRNQYLFKEIDLYAPGGIVTSNGQKWKYSRKILSTSMSIQSLKHSIPNLNKHCSRLVKELKKLFDDGQAHPIMDLCSLALFDIIGEVITGLDLHGSIGALKLRNGILEAEDLITLKLIKPWLTIPLIWKFHPDSKREKHLISYSNSWCKQVIRRRQQERALESPDEIPTYQKTMIDLLLDSNMSEEQMATEILLMFVGGYDTSAAAIQFFCFLMALHPEYQTKCRQEIESVLGDRQEVTWDDTNNLKYLDQCISETLRMFPGILLESRTLEEPLTLDENQVLPIGTNILILIQAMHRNPEYYPNPDKFDPNRFKPEEISKRPSGSYIPFLFGQRNCLGFKFAIVELKVLAAYILRNFELSTEHTFNEIPIVASFAIKPERDYIFSCKVLT